MRGIRCRRGAPLAVLVAAACTSVPLPDTRSPSPQPRPVATIEAPPLVPSTGEVVWTAQGSGGELGLTQFDADFMAAPAEPIRACHARGREAAPDEAGWELLRVVVVAGNVTNARVVSSQGLPASTLDCVRQALLTARDRPDASTSPWAQGADPRPRTLDLYIALR